jgi:superfamily II DNA or RNA helicase/transposase-like protein
VNTDVVASWVKQHAPSLEVRQYQLEAWQKLWEARKTGSKRALIHLATGLGKTSVAAVDTLRYRRVESTNARVLFVVHMTDIARQAKQSFERVEPGVTSWLYRSDQKLHDVPLTFATFQSLQTNLSTIPSDYFDYVVWDEAHHTEAKTYAEVREHFTPKFELALTATPNRADGLDIFEYFGNPIYSKSLAEGMAEGWLSAVDYRIVFDKTLREAIDGHFDVKSTKELRKLFKVQVRDEVISDEVLQRRQAIGLAEAKTIVFCSSILQAARMAELLGGKVLHAGLNKATRQNVLQDFRSGALQLICTVDMFNEGVDIPDARLIVFLRSTSSRTIFEQQLGRGLRLSPGKTHVTALDFVANIERIEFTRDLGHTVSSLRGKLEEYNGKNSSGGQATVDTTHYTPSQFQFDEMAVRLLDKYKEASLEPLPAGYITASELSKQINVSLAIVAGVIKRRYVASDYKKYMHNGRIVNGLSPKQSQDIAKYIASHPEAKPTREAVVEAYKADKKVSQIAKQLSISYEAVYKHLKKAGVYDSPLHKTRLLSDEVVVAAYRKHKSVVKTAQVLGISTETVRTRLKKAGTRVAKSAKIYATPELIDAYSNLGSVRKAAAKLGLSKESATKMLKNSGIDTSKKPFRITREELRRLYSQHRTTTNVAQVCRVSVNTISKELIKYHYFKYDNATPKQWEAIRAYDKYSSGPPAAAALGISTTLLYRRLREAGYNPRTYGKGRNNITKEKTNASK